MNNYEAFYEEIKQREKRYEAFNIPLSNALDKLAQSVFVELNDLSEYKKKELYLRAFFRTGELADFMLIRVQDGEQDLEVDVTALVVPDRKTVELEGVEIEGNLLKAKSAGLAYDSFELAKKMLWEGFPEISEFSGNSILLMNKWTFSRMCMFAVNVQDILDED